MLCPNGVSRLGLLGSAWPGGTIANVQTQLTHSPFMLAWYHKLVDGGVQGQDYEL